MLSQGYADEIEATLDARGEHLSLLEFGSSL
jgi:hypothetical protein